MALIAVACKQPINIQNQGPVQGGNNAAISNSSGKIVGEWRGSGPSGVGGNISNYALTLGPDGSYDYKVDAIDSKGTYQYDDSNKTISMTPASRPYSVSWSGDNQITIVNLSGDVILTRS